MFFRNPRFPVGALLLCFLSAAPLVQAQSVNKGNLILIERGLQLQGMTTSGDVFHLSTYTNANYTSVNWLWDANLSLLGPAPGFPWSRWVDNETNMPGMPSRAGEAPYISQLVSLQLADEWDLNNDTIRTRAVDWFAEAKPNFPNTILYANNFGGQVEDGKLSDFINRARPDMICFDAYPFQNVWDGAQPDHIGAIVPGQFAWWYTELRRYRAWGMTYNTPVATYMQTFHAVQDYDAHVYRNPSASELRLNTFGALAFNAKCLIGFTYNTGASSLFDPPGGDSNTNSLYAEQMDLNLRARNLGKALVCLTSMYDLHNTNTVSPPPGPGSDDPSFQNGYATSIMFLRGRILSGGVTNLTPLPGSFLADPQAPANQNNPQNVIYSWWETDKYDPYMRGWVVTNKAGIKNDGLPGEVIIAWFRPLDESLDGTTYSNQVYIMVVNGLTATNGTPADCLQEIKLNFLNTAATTTVDMLNPTNGTVQTVPLPVVSTRRQLVLTLNGGDAALFKFSTGAPFVGFLPLQPAKLVAGLQSGSPAITIQGTVGTRYQLQRATSLSASNWTTITNFLLPSASYTYVDSAAPPSLLKFYRAIATR